MKRLLLIAFVVLFNIINAQIPTFTKHYYFIGNEFGYSVDETPDDGFIIAGTVDRNDYDLFVFKTDKFGDTLWSKIYEKTGEEVAQQILVTADGGYIVVGRTDPSSTGTGINDVYLVKLSSAGAIEWTKTYGGIDDDWGRSIAETPDGGYIIAGATRSSGQGEYDVYLAKVNAGGSLEWSKTFGDTLIDFANSVRPTSDGGYILTGVTGTHVTYRNMYIIKTNSAGDAVWSKSLGEDKDDGGTSIKQSADGGYVATGWFTHNTGDLDVYIVKLNSSGNIQWETKVGDPAINEYGNSIGLANDGGFVVAGDQTPVGYFAKTNASGGLMWTRTLIVSSDTTSTQSIILTRDGGFAATGFTMNSANRIFLTKADTLGPELTGIENAYVKSKDNLKFAPNPVETHLTVSLTGTQTETIEIYDIIGNKIREISLIDNRTEKVRINREGLNPGVYIIQARSKRGIVGASRIVVK